MHSFPFVTITGASGSGKTTVVRELEKHGWVEAVSTTTRAPRLGEKNGVAYWFVGEEEFDALYSHGEFLETVEFSGNKYGITKSEIQHKTNEAPCAIVVDGSGAVQIHENYHGGPLFRVYLDVRPHVLEARMALRGDTDEEIRKRLGHDADKFDRWKTGIPWDLVIRNEDPQGIDRTAGLIRALTEWDNFVWV